MKVNIYRANKTFFTVFAITIYNRVFVYSEGT